MSLNKSKKLVLLAYLVILCTVAADAQSAHPSLHLVRKIYVGEMGKSDEAERFRILLGDELRERGFTVVDDPQAADAVMTGILSMTVEDGDSLARATVKLMAVSGKDPLNDLNRSLDNVLSNKPDGLLWSGEASPGPPPLKLHVSHDTVKLRAEAIAEKLKKAWDKSAKKATGK